MKIGVSTIEIVNLKIYIKIKENIFDSIKKN